MVQKILHTYMIYISLMNQNFSKFRNLKQPGMRPQRRNDTEQGIETAKYDN